MNAERDIRTMLEAISDEESARRAEADIAAGRVVDHAEVSKWLEARARGERIPMPREWLE